MAAQSGNAAVFKWNLSTIGELAAIGGVTLDGAVIDVSELSADANRQFIAGKYQCSWQVDLHYNHTAHQSLTADFLTRTSRAFEIDFTDGNISGTAILTNVGIVAGLDDSVRISVSGTCVGAVTITA